jgi:hypothetical protein
MTDTTRDIDIAGDHGTATAGDEGTATAGDGGTATAGRYGTATAGRYGTATAGNWGTATAGHWGTATAGQYGTATAGHGGCIVLTWWDRKAKRHRIVVGYIGENGLLPNTPYHCNDEGVIVPANEANGLTDNDGEG